MRAVRVLGPGQMEVADLPEPSPDGGVLVRLATAGICGTDVKILEGAIPVRYPRVMGHELVGTVEYAPRGSVLESGDRVLVDPGVSCGECDLCLAGRRNICRRGGLMGRDVDGVFAEMVEVPADGTIPIPEQITPKASGLLQVLGTCVHAVRQPSAEPGRVAVVIGLGVAGQLISQLLTLRGMVVVGSTRSDWKLATARAAGVAHAVAPAGLGSTVDDLTEGRGPALVVEAVGTEATLSQAVEMVGIGGEVLVFGTVASGSRGLPYYEMYRKELVIHNPRAAVLEDYVQAVEIAAGGSLTLEPLVSHQLTLEEAVMAFRLVEDPASLKVLMTR